MWAGRWRRAGARFLALAHAHHAAVLHVEIQLPLTRMQRKRKPEWRGESWATARYGVAPGAGRNEFRQNASAKPLPCD